MRLRRVAPEGSASGEASGEASSVMPRMIMPPGIFRKRNYDDRYIRCDPKRLQLHTLEVRELRELVEPLLDPLPRQPADAPDRELLDGEAPHHAAHDHRG